MQPHEKSILSVTCFGHFMSHFNMLVFPPLVLPLAGRLDMDLAAVLGLGFWMYLFFGLGALPWGILADRWGAKPLLMLFFAGAGACGLGAAFFTDNPSLLALSLAGVGLFSAIYHPAGLGLIARGVDRVSIAMAYNGIFGNLGLAAAPLLTGLVNWLAGPQAALGLLAALNLTGVAMMAAMSVHEPPKVAHKKEDVSGGVWLPFVILLVCMMLGGMTYRATTVTLPAYFELNTQGILEALAAAWPGDLTSNLVATLITSGIFLIGALGQYSGGRVGDRFDSRWGYLIYHAISIPAVLAMAWLVNWPLVAAALVYTFFLLGMQPMENTLVARLSPPAWKHSAYGAKFVLTFGVGSLSVKLAGWIQANWGMPVVFTTLGVITVLLVACIGLLITRTNPVRQAAPAPAPAPIMGPPL